MAEPRAADRTVPPLVGPLPPQCRKDVESLRRFVRGTVAREAPAAPVSPDEFREVLLTGATGFVGRFLLRALLAQNRRLIVHCLVRADSAQHGLERLRDAMEYAEIWDDSFASRVRAVTGDMCADRFGQSESAFGELCRRIDAVYHVAADVNLMSSYREIRQANMLGLRPFLELCLRERRKHLFYFSTMGIFPEYFGDFAKEFSQSHIGDQAQPDLAGMKKLFPLGIFGYPWSKLVAEQCLLFAQSAGVPIAIFRLPQMGPASTGFAQADNVWARIFAAAMQVEMAPHHFSIQRNSEPVDTVSEICAAISTNPRRRFTIYHCCDPQPPYDRFEVADFGFYWRHVPYRTFKRVCQALGGSSPLHEQWVLVDYFASYWWCEGKLGRTLPIGDRAIREDCPHPIAWPALLIRHARSHAWIRRHREAWPYAMAEARLDVDCLLAEARGAAARMGVPFEQTCPVGMQDGLRHLVDALNAPDAGLSESRISHVVYGFSRTLRSNAALVRERRQHPEIAQAAIEKPVFIVGINRTGTTFLHRLLTRDRRFWALRRYELTEPVLPTGEYGTVAGTAGDPRRGYAQEVMGAVRVADTLSGIHHMDIDEPEEDFMLLWHAFATWVLTVAHHVPDYGRWLAAAGSREAYAHHRRMMQHFTWQRRQREPDAERRWLLKMPFHLKELGVLLETYPDAVFIQTHREPAEFMGSWYSVVERIRSFTTEPRPPHETGAEQLALMSGMLNDAMRFRASRPDLEERWVDVRYVDLVDDPMAVVKTIYGRLGWPLGHETGSAMEDWLARQAAHRRQERRHEYSLEGLRPHAGGRGRGLRTLSGIRGGARPPLIAGGGGASRGGYSWRPSATITSAGRTNRMATVDATRPPSMLTTKGTKAISASPRS